MNKIIQDRHVCDLLIYFNRPYALQHLTYPALFQQYLYNVKLPAQFRYTNTNNGNNIYYEIYMHHMLKTFYLYKRNQRLRSITRLEMVALTIVKNGIYV